MDELRETSQTTVYKNRRFFIFIAAMRVVATVLITNTHFGKIWPISQLAVGGLIGDLLFFAVSGFCLINSGDNGFAQFAQKRVLRIYPTIIIITLVFFLCGKMQISGWLGRMGIIGRFVYPTTFHFIESIILLYICLYPCMRLGFLKKRLPVVMIVVAAAFFIAYVFADRTVRLDTAAHYLTKFLFFEVMLYGAYMRQKVDEYKKPVLEWLLFFASIMAYFVSKMLINEKQFADLQFIIFVCAFLVGSTSIRAFSGIEKLFRKLPQRITAMLKFIADLTLEIYVVQTTLIGIVVSWGLPFVLRFPLVVFLIFAAAFVCNRTAKIAVKSLAFLISKCCNKKA